MDGTKLLRPREVAVRLGVTEKTVRVWIRDGDLSVVELPGRAIGIRESDLEEWIASRLTNRGAS